MQLIYKYIQVFLFAVINAFTMQRSYFYHIKFQGFFKLSQNTDFCNKTLPLSVIPQTEQKILNQHNF